MVVRDVGCGLGFADWKSCSRSSRFRAQSFMYRSVMRFRKVSWVLGSLSLGFVSREDVVI